MKCINILHIDDDESTLKLMKNLLENENEAFKVTSILVTAQSMLDLRFLEDQKYDIIISDYQMPVLNGLEFIEKIRKNRHKTPVIIVSGQEQVEIPKELLVRH
ncbi:MAG: response regulator transcription factor [Candidatus Hermodarchaeota archaeon]